VEEMQARFESGPDPEWICECGDETCFEKLTVPVDEYHEIRSHDDWFLILPGHELLDVERVVEHRSSYVVVQKDGV
jgi:hypothetical protein